MTWMKFKILIIIIIFWTAGCSKRVDYSKQPISINPLWKELSGQLQLSFGQHIKIGSYNALVADISVDDGGIWYGLCFFNEQGLFGRQIPSSISTTGCINLLDIEYINERNLPTFKIIETLNIIKQISVGKEAPATSNAELMSSYKRGLRQRTLEQIPCNEEIYDLTPIRETYFELNSYAVQGTEQTND